MWPSWTIWMWFFKFPAWENDLWQASHLCDFFILSLFSTWILIRWFLRIFDDLNKFSQIWHLFMVLACSKLGFKVKSKINTNSQLSALGKLLIVFTILLFLLILPLKYKTRSQICRQRHPPFNKHLNSMQEHWTQ